jgi:sugar lactone lactonase YvrE
VIFAITVVSVSPTALAQDMPLSQVLAPDEEWELVADGLGFAEGPSVDKSGRLFFSDVRGSKIYKVDLDGKVSVFVENSRGTNGMMFGPDDRLYGCQMRGRRIVAYDPDGTEHTIAADVSPNDLVVTREGGVYFTDPRSHEVWFVPPKGKARVVDKGIERPNGIILWPGQGTLVVADTYSPHLWAFRIEADGSLSNKQPYYTMRITRGKNLASGADGMTVDSAGRLYVATYAGLQMFDTQGRISGVIAKPHEPRLSNVVFAGKDLNFLYVTAGDKVFRRTTRVRGVRFFEPSTRSASK